MYEAYEMSDLLKWSNLLFKSRVISENVRATLDTLIAKCDMFGSCTVPLDEIAECRKPAVSRSAISSHICILQEKNVIAASKTRPITYQILKPFRTIKWGMVYDKD